jgi:TonB family protein
MEQQEKLTTQQYVVDRLHDIQRKAEGGNFTDALQMIREVKAADAKNIYLIAIEKQIAKLGDQSLPEENRTGIVKSLPQMLERAISDIQRRIPAGPTVEETQKNQKEAALEKLKSQYFQRADDYVEKHEYQRALEEIRRIYIIEPGSVVAKEYEKKIEQLAVLHARNEAEAAASAKIKETKADIKEPKVEAKKPKKAIADIEPPKEKVVLQPEKEKVVLQPEEEEKKSKLPIYIAAAAVMILAIGAWILFSRNSSSDTQTNQQQTQQPSPMQDSMMIPSPATTSTPQSGKGSAPIAEALKPPVKIEKKQPEVKPVQPAVTSPVTTQPTNTKPQAGQTPSVTPTQQPVQQPATTESTPAPMPFVAIENPPEVIRREPAKYPEIAIKLGIQGRVTVEVTVDVQGKPIQAKVVKSPSDIFNDAAVEAVMKYTFKPATQSTGPVTAKMYIPIDFRLK